MKKAERARLLQAEAARLEQLLAGLGLRVQKLEDARPAVETAMRDLGVLRDGPDLLSPRPSPWERATDAVGDVIGREKATLFTRVTERLGSRRVQNGRMRLVIQAPGCARVDPPAVRGGVEAA